MKIKILSFVLCFVLLLSVFSLSVFADEKSKDVNREEPKEALPELNDKNDRSFTDHIVDYYLLDYSFSGSGLQDIGIDSFATVDILLSDGYYIRLTDPSLSMRSVDVVGLEYDEVVYSFILNSEYLCQVDYSYTILDTGYFQSTNSDNILILSPFGLFASTGSQTKIVSNVVAFRLLDIEQSEVLYSDPLYYGCSSSDFVTSISLDDYCDIAFLEPTFTLSDWFFEKAYPVFGSSMQDTIDLGILGTYQPMQLYKFLFCLALVIASIILLVWLPLHLFLRLIGVKRKKKG